MWKERERVEIKSIDGVFSVGILGFVLVKRLRMDPISQYSKTLLDPKGTGMGNIII